MRLLHVNHRYAPFVGGSERFIQEVSEHRVQLGDDATVMASNAFDLEYLWDASSRKIEAPERETLNGVQVARVPVRHILGGEYGLHAVRRVTMFASILDRSGSASSRIARLMPWLPGLHEAFREAGRVDLVHATNLGLEGLALAAGDYARATRAALVVTPFFHLGNCEDTYARRHASQAHQRRLLRQADSVVAMTSFEAEFLQNLGVDKRNIVVAGVGVHPSEVAGGNAEDFRSRHGVTSRFLIAAIGAMAVEKGTPHVVRAVAELRSRGIDVELVLAGPELTGFTRWFERLPETQRDGVQRLGVIDAPTKRDLLAAIDVLALPSRTESFGIVYLEAWANQKPVIAADIDAVREVVQDGETGLIVRFGDVESIAAGIRRLLGSSELRSQIGRAGEAVVRQKYLWPLVLERVDRAYDIAMGRERSRGVP